MFQFANFVSLVLSVNGLKCISQPIQDAHGTKKHIDQKYFKPCFKNIDVSKLTFVSISLCSGMQQASITLLRYTELLKSLSDEPGSSLLFTVCSDLVVLMR